MTLPRTLATIAFICSACSASPSINVGNEGDGSVAGSGGASGFGGVGGFGGGDDTLTALITEPPSEMAIEVITISCAGECKQVLAIASGGNDPYTFTWSDGVTTAAREICATDDTTFAVTVNDTPIVDGEFPYAGQSATASVMAHVVTCPNDAGVDAGPGMGLCLENLSFEGMSRGTVDTAAPWVTCGAFPADNNSIWDATAFTSGWQLTPPHGETYLVTSTNGGVGRQGASQTTCGPLVAGATYHFTVQLASPIEGSGITQSQPSSLQVFAGNGACTTTELLWTSPAAGPAWNTYCVTLTPTQEATHITLQPAVNAGTPYGRLAVDHIVPVASCP